MSLCFPPGLDLETASVIPFTDASWGKVKENASQGGLLVGLIAKGAEKGQECPFAVLPWSSSRVRRVCRRTLSAETQMACLGLEHGDYLKTLLYEAYHPQFSVINYRDALQAREALLVVDAKSLCDFLLRDTGRLPSDKRLAIDLRLMQHYMAESRWHLKWVCGPQQLADSSTKSGARLDYLRWVTSNARYQLLEDGDLKKKVA